jgi:multidrug resistance efflux pump
MDLLLILTYVAVTTVVFKVFKIPLNKWTVPTAALGGIVLIGTLIVVMNYNHPYSETSREYFVTTPVIPTVKGRVIEVPVVKNKPIKKGEVLFKLDPAPYQFKLDSLKARLDAAVIDQDRAKELMRRGVGKQRDLDQASALVDQLTADSNGAQYNLDETVMRAPTDGWVTQMALHPGMMLMATPLRPAMVFVHDAEYYYVAWFRQNSTLRLQQGYEAEVAFDSIPGKVFSGEVDQVIAVIAQGEIQARGTLLSSATERFPGRVPVVIKITDADFVEYQKLIPGGAFGQTAIYSDHFEHVAIMRKILLRMSSWMNFLFPFH